MENGRNTTGVETEMLISGELSERTININTCTRPSDPLNKSPSPIEEWFTEEMYNEIFYKSNLGFGPHPCLPYSYEAFILAARYFPLFGSEFKDSMLICIHAHFLQKTRSQVGFRSPIRLI